MNILGVICFRPLFWQTFFVVPILFILICFGTWQLKRMEWKAQLITDFQSRIMAPPIRLPAKPVGPELEFRRLEITGYFNHDLEVLMTGRTQNGRIGFHIVTPFILNDGRTILINRGWIPESLREPNKRLITLKKGLITILVIMRFPRKKGYFVPENEPEKGTWFSIIPSQIALHQGMKGRVETDFYFTSIGGANDAKIPIPISTEINLHNRHLGYAITWYGIACSLLIIYLAFHYKAGRLKLI